MKKLMTLLVVLSTTTTLFAQMPASNELAKYDGIPSINITKTYFEGVKGLTPAPDGEVFWSTIKDIKYAWTEVMLGDPKTLNYEEKFGLKVARIEAFCQPGYDYENEDNEAEGIAFYGLSIFFELPESSDEVADFMGGFIELHGNYMTAYRETDANEEGEVEMFMWTSTNDCGAMMELPKVMSLEACESDGHQYIELRFTQSCGG